MTTWLDHANLLQLLAVEARTKAADLRVEAKEAEEYAERCDKECVELIRGSRPRTQVGMTVMVRNAWHFHHAKHNGGTGTYLGYVVGWTNSTKPQVVDFRDMDMWRRCEETRDKGGRFRNVYAQDEYFGNCTPFTFQ